MRQRWRQVVLVAAAACALTAPAIVRAEWIRIVTSSEGSEYSVDAERIRTVGGRRQVWVKGDHSRNRGERARSSMTLYSVDCSAFTIKLLSDTRYDSMGKVVSSRSYPDYSVGYDPIAPETIAESVANRACSTDGAGF